MLFPDSSLLHRKDRHRAEMFWRTRHRVIGHEVSPHFQGETLDVRSCNIIWETIRLKKIKCKLCLQHWYMEDEEVDKIKACPVCLADLRKKGTISKADSLGKALYMAVSERGRDILANPSQISGYLFDIVPELRKEVRIFSKFFSGEYLAVYRDAFEMDIPDAEVSMNKLKHALVEEEGLSQTWADMLYENCLTAIKYTKGIGLQDIMLAEVTEVNFKKNQRTDAVQITASKRNTGAVKERTEETSFDCRTISAGVWHTVGL